MTKSLYTEIDETIFAGSFQTKEKLKEFFRSVLSSDNEVMRIESELSKFRPYK
jgi:hypothetical protein